MAGPNPILATHRLEWQVAVPGARPHKMRAYVNAVPDALAADGYSFKQASGGGGQVFMENAVADMFAVIKPFWPVVCTIGNFILQQYAAGAYIPIASDPLSGPGTSVNPVNIAEQSTFVFYDSANRKVRDIFLETEYGYVGHVTLASQLAQPAASYVAETLSNTQPLLGYWVVSRSGLKITRFVSQTLGTNNKIRRERGVV